jgi:anti-sigma factor RsiW
MKGHLIRRFRVPPDCREVADTLQAYLDRELPSPKIEVVREHLEHCERCGIEAEVYLEVKRSLAQLATPPDDEAIGRLRAFADGLAGEDGP